MRRVALLLSVISLACLLAHSQDKQASVEALEQWSLRSTLMGHTTSVHSVAFSPDGKTVASASWDRSIILWDVETGAKKLVLKHGYHPHRVMFSPDGQFLYSSGGDGTVKKWNMQTGKAAAIIYDRSEILDLSFSADSDQLACDCREKTAEIIDAKTGKLKFSAPHGDYIYAVALSPGGNLLAVAGGHKNVPVELWDVQKGEVVRTFDGVKAAGSVAFSPDGRMLVVGSQEDTHIRLFDMATGELLQTLSKDGRGFPHLAFSPDGRLLAAVPNVVGLVYFYDLREQRWVGIISTDGVVSDIAFSPDGKMLATAGYDDRSVRIWSRPATYSSSNRTP